MSDYPYLNHYLEDQVEALEQEVTELRLAIHEQIETLKAEIEELKIRLGERESHPH